MYDGAFKSEVTVAKISPETLKCIANYKYKTITIVHPIYTLTSTYVNISRLINIGYQLLHRLNPPESAKNFDFW